MTTTDTLGVCFDGHIEITH